MFYRRAKVGVIVWRACRGLLLTLSFFQLLNVKDVKNGKIINLFPRARNPASVVVDILASA